MKNYVEKVITSLLVGGGLIYFTGCSNTLKAAKADLEKFMTTPKPVVESPLIPFSDNTSVEAYFFEDRETQMLFEYYMTRIAGLEKRSLSPEEKRTYLYGIDKEEAEKGIDKELDGIIKKESLQKHLRNYFNLREKHLNKELKKYLPNSREETKEPQQVNRGYKVF